MTTLAPPSPVLSLVRSDILPENAFYRDTGCDVSPACLTCPLPVCKYDDPGWLSRKDHRERDAKILSLRASGVSALGIARHLNISTRTVDRILRRGSSVTPAPAAEDEGPLLALKELAQRSLFKPRTPLPPIRGALASSSPRDAILSS